MRVDDLAPWANSVRAVARELQVPPVDLHARSGALVQALGPVPAMRLAQAPATQAQVAAALAGTTVDNDPALACAPAAVRNAAMEPMGQAKQAFDYTHLGDEGAQVFATLVTTELAVQVPELRPLLMP